MGYSIGFHSLVAARRSQHAIYLAPALWVVGLSVAAVTTTAVVDGLSRLSRGNHGVFLAGSWRGDRSWRIIAGQQWFYERSGWGRKPAWCWTLEAWTGLVANTSSRSIRLFHVADASSPGRRCVSHPWILLQPVSNLCHYPPYWPIGLAYYTMSAASAMITAKCHATSTPIITRMRIQWRTK